MKKGDQSSGIYGECYMTILFANDWMKYPNAIIHYETKNKSFLHLAHVYNKMGVENCAFLLALTQPELKDVDPYDPNLTIEMQAKVIMECKVNFWYYLREVQRISVKGSMESVHFQANRANIGLYWMFFNHITTVIIILRQTGKTTSIVALFTYLLNFGATNTFINFLTRSETLKGETLSKVKEMFEDLPDYLNFSTRKDIFNSDEVSIDLLKNKVQGSLSSSSPKQAEKVGRGFTSPINMIDEAAFIENIAIAMGAMLMSGNAARESARIHGKPYGTILATTAGNIDDRDGSYIYGIVTGSTRLNEKFYDSVDHKELLENIYKNSRATKNQTKRPIVNISLSYRQLGYSEDWLQERLSENISSAENIKRDLFSMWISGSNVSPIPREYLEILKENIVENPYTEFYAPHNYLITKYIDDDELAHREAAGHSFVIGVDTSDGAGGDDITFVVRDHTTGEVIITAVFNEINLITLADFFVSFLLKYRNSVMIIERRSSAASIIDYMITKLLAKDINPYTRLYNTIVQNKDKYPREYKEIMEARPSDEYTFIKYKKHIGFATSGGGVTARSELYSVTLMTMLKYTAHLTRDQDIITQLSGLVTKNNRIDHPSGGSDDMVIAALLSFWLLTNGVNLNIYGIDSGKILRANNIYLNDKFATQERKMNEEEAMEMEREFNNLIADYEEETNPTIARKLEIKIRMYARDMNQGNGGAVSIEEMLETIGREKKLRSLQRR